MDLSYFPQIILIASVGGVALTVLLMLFGVIELRAALPVILMAWLAGTITYWVARGYVYDHLPNQGRHNEHRREQGIDGCDVWQYEDENNQTHFYLTCQ